MEEIDFDTWSRKEHYAFFMMNDLPFYNVSFNIQVNGLRSYCKSRGISLTNTLIYYTVKSLNAVDSFLYRNVGGKIVKYPSLHPSFSCLREGEELFRLITVDFDSDILRFDRMVKDEIRQSKKYFDASRLQGRSDFVFISSLPWLPFTAIDHTLSLKKEDAIPRVSWGKIVTAGDDSYIPFNIRVNHAFIDGIHVGKFYDELQRNMHSLG